MHNGTHAGLAFLTAALSAAPALAQTEAAIGQFATLDRSGAGDQAGISMSLVKLDGHRDEEGITGTRLDLYGQYMLTRAAGLYLSLPVSRILSAEGDDRTSLGNVGLGAVYHFPLGQTTGLTFQGGLLVNTASDDVSGLVGNAISSLSRITDSATAIPANWIRLGVSPTARQGIFFARADLGVDVPLGNARMTASDDLAGLVEPDATFEAELDPLVRVNAGAGLDLGPVAAMAEFAARVDTAEHPEGERVTRTGALTLARSSGTLQPYASFVLPLHEEGLGDVWMGVAGLRAQL
jgi:hypothetical protein